MDYIILLWNGTEAEYSRVGGMPDNSWDAMMQIMADLGVFYNKSFYSGKVCDITIWQLSIPNMKLKDVPLA